MSKLQLNGTLTIVKSAGLTDEQKASVLHAPEGKVRGIRVELVDPDGNSVVLEGPLRLSEKKGSLTTSVTAKITSFELVELDKVQKGDEEKTVDEMSKELLSA